MYDILDTKGPVAQRLEQRTHNLLGTRRAFVLSMI